MALEIERKFLIRSDGWRDLVNKSVVMEQSYLATGSGTAVRVRVAGDSARLTLKQEVPGSTRLEFEYEIPLADARTILNQLALPHPILKTRHIVPAGELAWEIDEFTGENSGLVVAEIELPNVDHPLPEAVWLGMEVTDDIRFYNTELSRRPFKSWSEEERNAISQEG